ncbi:acylphosphatase [Aeromicrobium sp.]|uniref:acylphosphatase n=1 Tax=Aeromicrobium sp. TaxID=1871063 RepID=UPI0030C36A0C
MIRRRVVVRGTVQGVFFRASCRDEAWAQGVRGWVSNRPDGAVEAVFEGDRDAVMTMVAWSGHGPPQAVVENVEVTEEDPRGLSDFSVR